MGQAGPLVADAQLGVDALGRVQRQAGIGVLGSEGLVGLLGQGARGQRFPLGVVAYRMGLCIEFLLSAWPHWPATARLSSSTVGLPQQDMENFRSLPTSVMPLSRS